VANDHYVAQTYLRHWLRPGQKLLHAYSKASGKEFPCRPADICREWNGDLNPKYFKNPNVLGEFRKIFEPRWRQTVENILAGKITADDKFVAAGYWAHLTTCTPAWRRICAATYEHELRNLLPSVAKDIGVPQGVDLDRMRIEIEDDFTKHLVTKWLLRVTALLYHQTWTIFENDTGYEFLTSDNPSAIIPKDHPNQLLVRTLPLSPRLCLSCAIDVRCANIDPDPTLPPRGNIDRVRIDSERAKYINKLIVLSAEDIVVSSVQNEAIKRMVSKRAGFRLKLDYASRPIGNDGEFLQGASIRVGKNTI
jgi:hypothetical protein